MFEAHRLLYHQIPGVRVIKKKKRKGRADLPVSTTLPPPSTRTFPCCPGSKLATLLCG